MRKKLLLVSAFILIVSVFLLSACAGESSSGGGGKGGDRITLYSPETPDMSKELAQKYEEINGGKVDVQYAGTNVLVNRMMAEKDNPQADVWYGGGGSLPFEAAADKGIITSYIPESAEKWDVTEDGIKLKHQDGKYVGVEMFVLGFSYNTELVKPEEAPKTWEDLLDPKWKGKIQFSNPAASGTSTLMVLSYMMQHGEKEGWEYFKKLSKQANSIPDSGSGPTKAVSMGEAYIGVGFDFMAYEQKAKGESVDFVVPDKTPILVNPASLVEKGPNPKGGKKFIDFLLSKEGQQILANWYHIPLNPDVKSKTPLTLEKVKPHAVDLDIDWVNENYDRIRNEWKEKFQ
ncbi:ABC transporter substrate-binding protein [Heyndrickxia sporothermodurans]|uniref:ABC transporter substrate-binding protein n=1 Tax=Heyndrickxia TaxID=2837504 RepID=UPI000D33191C|nr:extracellular solute-binding protein [Heyndrickxia sporothermodurans]MBL5768991.1 extracellular solute-binding protein [Heyndrickxia sporothermodurans]MBL5772769.1 extracellular solute-binding protein [Heyndrickxia sporothermodurans]MBL5779791.1 extracellular solute-binding protein [Heyndrickxia sporothermodurans]MBL5783358.1 extracellular solute-binding protein [Heyndrickxia sporothermodurans]MBL5786867.1 extracellular solute-binding protein [Heyndrickxia sporothermodurans]